ncbi:MAG TPA: ATP-binding protein, partial [Dehalococcoidia bacterium]
MACLAEPVPARLAAAVAGLLNSEGGHVLVGIQADEETGRVTGVPGLLPEFKPEIITEALRLIDPHPAAAGELVTYRDVYLREGTHRVTVIAVRRSPHAPHIVTRTGLIHYWTKDGLQTVTSRAELDRIYERGRDSRQRVQRIIEAMVERVSLSHYAFMGVVVIVATARPTALPFLWAREHVAEVLDPADPFVARWGFQESMAQVRPGELEVHTRHETSGFIRVTRSGGVAVGEVDRRPYHNELGSAAELREKLRTLLGTARRLLAPAYQGEVLPFVLLE